MKGHRKFSAWKLMSIYVACNYEALTLTRLDDEMTV